MYEWEFPIGKTYLMESGCWEGLCLVSPGFTVECHRNVQCTKLQDSQHAIFALITVIAIHVPLLNYICPLSPCKLPNMILQTGQVLGAL